MRKLLLTLGALALICSSAIAGKNVNGIMAVHTDDAHGWTNGVCDQFDNWVPQNCVDLNTRTDVDVNTPALIWFIAIFPQSSSPGVTVVYFGHDHSMPQYYHNRWGFCGPSGSLEVPDSGWPDAPATAGNSVAFGLPVAGDLIFPFYYFDVWGETGWHYCTAINPVGGYAGFVDDSNPPELDYCEHFGCVYYGTDQGYNDCPVGPLPGACCFEDGHCELATGYTECHDIGGWTWLGEGIPCDPNPCGQPGACCFAHGHCDMLPEGLCDLAGGGWLGEDYDCDPNPCPSGPGACCFENGVCLDIPVSECEGQGGEWLGEDIRCDPNPCPQPPPEACCFEDGTCIMYTPVECLDAGGEPWGTGTECDPNPCGPIELGACCFDDGSCQVRTEDDCYDHDAHVWIPDEFCDPNPCPQPGACCYGCEECIVLLEDDCHDLPDWYDWIADEDCDPNPCPPIATETTTWGSIKADYK